MYFHALNFNPRKEVSFTNSYVQEEINAVTLDFTKHKNYPSPSIRLKLI